MHTLYEAVPPIRCQAVDVGKFYPAWLTRSAARPTAAPTSHSLHVFF